MEPPNLEEQLELRITLLENANQRRRWYSESSNYIAGIGVVIALASLIFSYNTKSAEEIHLKSEELRKTISQIIDLRTAIYMYEYEQPYNPLRVMADEKKKDIYLESAEYLASQIPDKVSSLEYQTIANEVRLNGNYRKAQYYGEKAIVASKDIYSKVSALRDIAYFYFSFPHETRDITKARSYYQQAIDLLNNPKDDFQIAMLGRTYLLWGLDEIGNGFEGAESHKIKLARKYFLDLSDMDLKESHLRTVDIMVQDRLSGKVQETNRQNLKPLPKFDEKQKNRR